MYVCIWMKGIISPKCIFPFIPLQKWLGLYVRLTLSKWAVNVICSKRLFPWFDLHWLVYGHVSIFDLIPSAKPSQTQFQGNSCAVYAWRVFCVHILTNWNAWLTTAVLLHSSRQRMCLNDKSFKSYTKWIQKHTKSCNKETKLYYLSNSNF